MAKGVGGVCSVATSTDSHTAPSFGDLASVAFSHDCLTPEPESAGTRCVTSVTLSTWTRALHSCRDRWQAVALIGRGKEEHIMRRTQADVGQSLTELVVPVRVNSSGGTSQELSSSMLIDLSSEVLALGPGAFFQGRALELARRPLRITVANGERRNGGTHGAVVDLSVQIQDCSNQPVQVVCERVFVYKADVHEQRIVGYPFCKAYGLMVDPTRDLLVNALCGTMNCTAQHCPCTSVQCGCRAIAVSSKKSSMTKSYVARLINLASDSEDESLPRQAPPLVHRQGMTVASVAAMYVTRFLPAIAAPCNRSVLISRWFTILCSCHFRTHTH